MYEQAISISNNFHKGFYIGFIGFPITIAIKCQCNSFQNTLYNSVIQPVIQPVSYVGGQEALGRKIPLFRNSLESAQDLNFILGIQTKTMIHIEKKEKKNFYQNYQQSRQKFGKCFENIQRKLRCTLDWIPKLKIKS